MKKTISIVAATICLIIGYVLGNFVPLNQLGFNLFTKLDPGIKGDAILEVTLIMDNGLPLENVEVDLADQPGAPPVGGVAITDQNGLAVFNVKPGKYFVFFNDNNFPKNVKSPELQPVEVKSGEINKIEILMTLK